jgi:membrane protein YqaA with SNARE-associated domain
MHRRIYEWTIHWARTPRAAQALALIAFAESSFFPVPPDVLLIAMCLARPKRSFFYAIICSAGSVLGGMLGYLIGLGLWEAVGPFFFRYIPGFTEGAFNTVASLYQENAFWTVFTAGFTPIPYKVFTITGGVCKISFATLVAASALGRSGRFFLVGGLIFFFGEPVRNFIEKYLGWLTIAFAVLLIGGFFLISKLVH